MRASHTLILAACVALAATAAAAGPPSRGVTALGDTSFEHTTQAATGQTTGRWLVALWPGGIPPSLAGTLARAARGAPNTFAAAVDTTADPKTAARFGTGPSVFVLADRAMYRYRGLVVDGAGDDAVSEAALAAFTADPTGVPGEPVPPESASIDVLAAVKSAWAGVVEKAEEAGVDVESLAAAAHRALDAAPGGAAGAAAAGLGGLVVAAIAVARAGGKRAATGGARGAAARRAKKRA
jgi:hypothetical protein